MGGDTKQCPALVQSRLRQQVKALREPCLYMGKSDLTFFQGQLVFCNCKETGAGKSNGRFVNCSNNSPKTWSLTLLRQTLRPNSCWSHHQLIDCGNCWSVQTP